jgi:hypothetical protein
VGLGGGLDFAEGVEGAVVGAVGGIEAALEAGEGAGAVGGHVADGVVLIDVDGGLDFVPPDLGFGATEAAELPIGGDEGIDQEALLGCLGMEAVVVVEDEGFEVFGVFTGDDGRLGVNAGFEGVHAGGGFAAIGARTGGGLGVTAVGLDLA